MFKIIRKVIELHGGENTVHLYKNRDDDALYRYYAYNILLEYFDNIVSQSNNKNYATLENINDLCEKMRDMYVAT